ncbi:MAG TPA: thermonuclease family protein, partial [Candidatus Omnitrophota bacterium]|nr:thermonuclease family protein [Candidatus Omnitrophota bacterium]
YTYRAWIVRVLDGDTVKAVIDLGFGVRSTQVLRLRGIDAPELVSADGKKAKEFLEKKLGLAEGEGLSDRMVLVRTEKSDKYDRYLADLFYTDKNGREIYLNQEILAAGLAIRMGE